MKFYLLVILFISQCLIYGDNLDLSDNHSVKRSRRENTNNVVSKDNKRSKRDSYSFEKSSKARVQSSAQQSSSYSVNFSNRTKTSSSNHVISKTNSSTVPKVPEYRKEMPQLDGIKIRKKNKANSNCRCFTTPTLLLLFFSFYNIYNLN